MKPYYLHGCTKNGASSLIGFPSARAPDSCEATTYAVKGCRVRGKSKTRRDLNRRARAKLRRELHTTLAEEG